jgi:hypothetical protein
MRLDTAKAKPIQSSFWSWEKDVEKILKELFVSSQPYSDMLKRLLVINTKDCLENNGNVVEEIIRNTNLATLRRDGYIKLEPKIRMSEHEEVKAYIIISCDNFTTNETNSFYRDCTVTFDIICHTDYWDLGDYRVRPLKIAGIIDGILNETKLTGIGTFNFMGCQEIVLNEDLSGYTLAYRAIHGNDDKIPPKV